MNADIKEVINYKKETIFELERADYKNGTDSRVRIRALWDEINFLRKEL